jgi:hypothetical protein
VATWASVLDLEERFESTLPDRATVVLEDAETLLTRKVKNLAARIEAETLDPNLVKMVICAAVLRELRNPRGYSWERDGDYSYGLAIGQPAAGAVGLFFTDAEIDLLLDTSTSAWSPVGTINLAHPYAIDDRSSRWPTPTPDVWSDNNLRPVGSLNAEPDDGGAALVP